MGSVSSGGRIAKGDDANNAISVVEFHARSTNGSPVIVGRSDVSALNGTEIPPGESLTIDLEGGSVLFNVFFATVPTGNILDWTIVMEN